MMTDTQQTIAVIDPERRFGGLARLYGADGARKIRAAHVVVVGLGGVGSWAAEALARSGVACLTLIDLDHIAESNINRQIHALDTTLGQAKVHAMRERIAHINPACEVRCVEEFVDVVNWPDIAGLNRSDELSVSVIDACDQVRAKTAMAAWALQHNSKCKGDKAGKAGKVSRPVNFISVGAAGGKRHAHKVDIDDLSLTTHDPLLAQLRYRLRKEQGAARHGKIGVTCVFSREAITQSASAALPATAAASTIENDGIILQASSDKGDAQSDGSLNCHGYGSVVSVTSTFGICAAGWVLEKIASVNF